MADIKKKLQLGVTNIGWLAAGNGNSTYKIDVYYGNVTEPLFNGKFIAKPKHIKTDKYLDLLDKFLKSPEGLVYENVDKDKAIADVAEMKKLIEKQEAEEKKALELQRAREAAEAAHIKEENERRRKEEEERKRQEEEQKSQEEERKQQEAARQQAEEQRKKQREEAFAKRQYEEQQKQAELARQKDQADFDEKQAKLNRDIISLNNERKSLENAKADLETQRKNLEIAREEQKAELEAKKKELEDSALDAEIDSDARNKKFLIGMIVSIVIAVICAGLSIFMYMNGTGGGNTTVGGDTSTTTTLDVDGIQYQMEINTEQLAEGQTEITIYGIASTKDADGNVSNKAIPLGVINLGDIGGSTKENSEEKTAEPEQTPEATAETTPESTENAEG